MEMKSDNCINHRRLGDIDRHIVRKPCDDAFKTGRLPDSLNDPRYFNIKMMQNLSLK